MEIAHDGELIAVRDSKDPDGPVLTVPSATFHAFLTRTQQR